MGRTSIDVDVLIAGAGAGGLAAALSARGAGAAPVIVEASPNARGSCTTAMSTGLVPGAGTPQQRAVGVEDGPDLFARDLVTRTRGTADAGTVETLSRTSAEVVRWLGDLAGEPLRLADDAVYPGHSRPRLHALPDRSGTALLGLLRNATEHLGIPIEAPLRLGRVVDDGDRLLVDVMRPDGAVEEVRVGAVVLATGGFVQDPRRRAQHLPAFAGTRYFGGDGNTGTALDVADTLGLAVDALGSYSAHGSYATRHGVLVTWTAVMAGGFIIDADGLRFADETMGYSGFAEHFARRPSPHGHLVLDRIALARCEGFPELRTVVAHGGVRWCEDVAGLAAATSAPQVALARTLGEVTSAAAGIAPDPHGRSHWDHAPGWPLGVIPVEPVISISQGGILVDDAARARRCGTAAPHPRVLAVGGAATGLSGVSGDGYLAGNGLLLALGLGLLGGRAAAAVTGASTDGDA